MLTGVHALITMPHIPQPWPRLPNTGGIFSNGWDKMTSFLLAYKVSEWQYPNFHLFLFHFFHVHFLDSNIYQPRLCTKNIILLTQKSLAPVNGTQKENWSTIFCLLCH